MHKIIDGVEVPLTSEELTALNAGIAAHAATMVQETQAQHVDAVKAEANRRILEIIPEWKQRNLMAQAAILAEKGRANWTPEELDAWNAGEAVWASIGVIRLRSDALEMMVPGSVDIMADETWEAP